MKLEPITQSEVSQKQIQNFKNKTPSEKHLGQNWIIHLFANPTLDH